MNKSMILISIFLILLNTSCAVKSSALQSMVQSRINEIKNTGPKISNVEIEINKKIELSNECKQGKNSFIPALFYWGWNSEVVCEFSKETLINELNGIVQSEIEISGLSESLKNRKLIIAIDELPTQFYYQEKGSVLFLVAPSYPAPGKYSGIKKKVYCFDGQEFQWEL